MRNSFLSGGELTALSMIYWTPDPLQFGMPEWLSNALTSLSKKGLIVMGQAGPSPIEANLTPKGLCLMQAILALPEPVQSWALPTQPA